MECPELGSFPLPGSLRTGCRPHVGSSRLVKAGYVKFLVSAGMAVITSGLLNCDKLLRKGKIYPIVGEIIDVTAFPK